MFIEWFIIVTSVLSMCLSVSFVLFVVFSTSIHSMSIALTCHSSIVIVAANIALILTGIFMLAFSYDQNYWCQMNAYLVQVTVILVYHSYYLQAFHRYSSVVHHRNATLRTPYIFLGVLIAQWLFAWLYPLRLLEFGLFTFNPEVNVCYLEWRSVHESILLLLVEYIIPLIIDAYFYLSVIKNAHLHITQVVHPSLGHYRNEIMISQEQRRIRRELKMLKRIILIYVALVILNGPNLVLTIMAAIDPQGSLTLEYLYRISLVIFSCMLALISVFQIVLTPSVKTLLQESIRRRINRI